LSPSATEQKLKRDRRREGFRDTADRRLQVRRHRTVGLQVSNPACRHPASLVRNPETNSGAGQGHCNQRHVLLPVHALSREASCNLFLIMVTGWLGGEIVFRHSVGVQ
jgi:hypothetical protein